VSRGENYVLTLKMYSSRTLNSECVNTQNPLGYHLSDGALYTYNTGNEYHDIAAAWDWNLIPGTTTSPGLDLLNCNTTEVTGVEDFVGGVSDSVRGIAAMKYTDPTSKKLSWQKAWFFLDGDVQHVSISNLAMEGGAEVVSVLDQRRAADSIVIDSQTRQTAGLTRVAVASTFHHGGVGYSLPQALISGGKITATVQVDSKHGNWSNIGTSTQPPSNVTLFTGLITHKDPSASVEYSMFPGTTPDTFQQKLKTSQLVTQQDGHISSVYDQANNVIYVVFWGASGGWASVQPKSGPAITFEASANCVLIYRVNDGKAILSDPSQTQKSIALEVSFGSRSTTLNFSLPSGGAAGSSMELTTSVGSSGGTAGSKTGRATTMGGSLTAMIFTLLTTFYYLSV
jgi:hypothetical protein